MRIALAVLLLMVGGCEGRIHPLPAMTASTGSSSWLLILPSFRSSTR